MQLYGFLDTETTGLFDKKWGLSDLRNPHICQVAVILADANGEVVDRLNRIVKPEGKIWCADSKSYLEAAIPPGASNVHRITTERAMAEGVPALQAVEEVSDILTRTTDIVIFNKWFDFKIMDIAFHRVKKSTDCYRGRIEHDLMAVAKPVLKLPPTPKMLQYGFNTYKTPSLKETYKFLFGKEFPDAHDAMVDAQALMEGFFEFKRRGLL